MLIWGKTYPELSTKYAETVCTAGVREDGTPVRLYPVPLRYLDTNSQYKLYDWIEAPMCKASDGRPESYKVEAEKIRKVGHIKPDRQGWAARAEFVFKQTGWQYTSMTALSADQKKQKKSLGIMTPGEIDRVIVTMKPESERVEYDRRLRDIQSQGNLFVSVYKELGYRPFEIRLRWRCLDRCAVCARSPHDMQILDWGLMELARKNNWDSGVAKTKMEDIAQSRDLKLFLGNTKQHQGNFLIVGLWYPKETEQLSLI